MTDRLYLSTPAENECSQNTNQDVASAVLQVTAELNQQILDSSDDCIKVLDLTGRILLVNRGGQRLLGIQDVSLFLNKPWAEFWEEADRQTALEAIAKARSGEVCTFQGYCPTFTGEPKWLDNKINPIRGADGQVERLLCISRDFTERRGIDNERQQVEERLRESEAHLSAIFSQAAVGLSEISLDGCFQRVNDELCRILARSRQEILSVSVLDLTVPEDGPKSWDAFQYLLKTGKSISLDKRYFRPDGTVVWANSNLSRLDDEQGRPRAVLAVTVDLSDRKRVEEAIQRSEEKYRSLFNSMDEGFCIVQLIFDEVQTPIDYRYIELNPAFEQQTGLSNALGKTVRELVPDIESFWVETYARVALTGEPTRFIDHSESLGRWFDVNAFRLGEPHERKVAVLFKDISDQMRAEEERKQAEVEREQLLANERHHTQQLKGLTAAALAINSALSVEDVLTVITEQATAIVGAHQAVASMTINQNWAQAITCIYLSEKYAQWKDYNEEPDGSGIYACVCHLNHPIRLTQAELEAHPRWNGFGKAAGKHPPMRGWLAAPLIGRDGHNIGLIQLSDKYEGEFTEADESILVQLAQMASVAVENARLYEAEQQARSAAEASREEAQAANRVKDEFLAVLSHELRSPLNPILGWSTLLQNKALDEAKTAQALATIQRNAKLQAELIEDLLDVSRILRGKLSLNAAPVNLATTIQAALEIVGLAADAKSIRIHANLAPDVGLVWGDSTRLQQVVWNLLSNAVKFTPAGGWVEVTLEQIGGERAEERGDAEVEESGWGGLEESVSNSALLSTSTSYSRLPSHAQITVSDTGQGIAPDFLPYVFDYFRQANAATTRKFGGLGLGLAIARHLVELHGGVVSVNSPGIDRGTTFTVRLPLMPLQVTAAQHERAPEPLPDLNGVRALVVDDDADSREFVAFVLQQVGATVTTATTAYDALVMLIHSQVDVLLSDIGMPDADGYMLMRQVRSLPPEQGGQIPAIALTAYAGELNQQKALAVGFQRHLAKPIEPDALVATVMSLLSTHRTSD